MNFDDASTYEITAELLKRLTAKFQSPRSNGIEFVPIHLMEKISGIFQLEIRYRQNKNNHDKGM